MKLLILAILLLTIIGCSGIEYTGNTYRYVEDSVSWTEAKALAEEQGGHLATISSLEELINVGYKLPIGQIAWVGLTDAEEEGVLRWIDGTPLIREMEGNVNSSVDRQIRDYGLITLNGILAARENSGPLPRNASGKPWVDGYLIEFDHENNDEQ